MHFIGLGNIAQLLRFAGDLVPYVPRKEWEMLHEDYIDITNQKGPEILEERIKEVLEQAYSHAEFWQQSGASTDELMSFGPTIHKIREGLPGILEDLYWPKVTAQNIYTYKNIKNLMGEVESDVDPAELSDEELDKYMESEEFLVKKKFSEQVNIAKFHFWTDATSDKSLYGFYLGIKAVRDCLVIDDKLFLPANTFWEDQGWGWEPIEYTGQRAETKLPPPEKIIPIDKYL